MKSTRADEKGGEHDAEHDADGRADQRRDHALVPDHAADLTARHADRAQHPDLARALEDRQDERVHDPEQRHEHRQREQHVEDVEDRSEPGDLVVDELPGGVWAFAFGKPASAASSAAWFSSVSSSLHRRGTRRDSADSGSARPTPLLDIVTLPNGEPPVGGSKMPFTANVLARAVREGHRSRSSRPRGRRRPRSRRRRRRRRRRASTKTSCDPSFQVMSMTSRRRPASTAVAKIGARRRRAPRRCERCRSP